MSQSTPRKRRPATALIAFARTLAMEDPVDQDLIDELVDSVCIAPSERVALISALQQINHGEIALVISDLVSRRSARLREKESGLQDLDEVLGIWAQRLSAGALLAAAGATIAGALTGWMAPVALAIPAIGGAAVAIGRLRIRRRRASLSREREETESLLHHALQSPGAR